MLIILLVGLQTVLLNRIVLFGAYSPVVYPVFVLFYPFFRNRYMFLVLSFILGLSIDAVVGTWGINAFATTAIAYFRTVIFRTSTENTTDFFSFESLQWSQFLFFIIVSVFAHQLLVQTIEFFKFSRILLILWNSVVTTLISFLFILLYVLIFRVKKRI